jgi:hypothetical protein
MIIFKTNYQQGVQMGTLKRWHITTVLLLGLSSLAMIAAESPRQNPILAPFEFDNGTRIDANLISMYVTNHGSFAYNISIGASGLEYPRGTGMYSVFASGLWIGATVNQDIRVTVAEYSTEYSPGFMENGGPNTQPELHHYRVYKLDSSSGPGDPDWDEWPVEEGAPADEFGNPLLIGDQTLWCVYNDADPLRHTNDAGNTEPLGLEIQQTVFAYDSADAFQYSILMKFLVINKGNNYLSDTYIALWSDPDLGGATDDLVGCDTVRWLGYCYNATNNDQIYGSTPPCICYDLLQGPIVTSPGDTALVSGETYPDFRNLPMTSFNKYFNGTDPRNAQESYWYMQGLNAVEGAGAPYINPQNGHTTTYVYPGDPVAGTGWLDSNPADRRFMLSSGPFDMDPTSAHNDSVIIGVTAQEVWAAIIIGHGTDRLNSITVMRENDEQMQVFFGGPSSSIRPSPRNNIPLQFQLHQNFPNPFNPTTVIRFDLAVMGTARLTVVDILGRTVAVLIDDHLAAGSYTVPWDASGLPSGIYFCRLKVDGFDQMKKLLYLK